MRSCSSIFSLLMTIHIHICFHVSYFQCIDLVVLQCVCRQTDDNVFLIKVFFLFACVCVFFSSSALISPTFNVKLNTKQFRSTAKTQLQHCDAQINKVKCNKVKL